MKSLLLILALCALCYSQQTFTYNQDLSTGAFQASPLPLKAETDFNNLCFYPNSIKFVPILLNNQYTGLQVVGDFPSNVTNCKNYNLTFTTAYPQAQSIVNLPDITVKDGIQQNAFNLIQSVTVNQNTTIVFPQLYVYKNDTVPVNGIVQTFEHVNSAFKIAAAGVFSLLVLLF